jgi:hypothetical protein
MTTRFWIAVRVRDARHDIELMLECRGEQRHVRTHVGICYDGYGQGPGVGQQSEPDRDVAHGFGDGGDIDDGPAEEGHLVGRATQVGDEGIHGPLAVDEPTDKMKCRQRTKGWSQQRCRRAAHCCLPRAHDPGSRLQSGDRRAGRRQRDRDDAHPVAQLLVAR